MKQIKTEEKTQTVGANLNRSALSMIKRSIGKISAALKPTKEDLNFSRWQELECRDYRVDDQFNQMHDRRFK
jgi:hypothetical protein